MPFIKLSKLITACTFFLALFFIFTATPVQATGTTYYVDASGGSDSNAGTSTGLAWKTLTKVNAALSASTIMAGDSILFKRGQTFTGNLVMKVSGTAGNVVTFSDYGTGAKPIINAVGNLHGIDIRNGLSYITIQNIDVNNATNEGFFLFNGDSNISINNTSVSSSTRGVYINTGTFSQIAVSNFSASSVSYGLVAGGFTSLSNLTVDATSVSGAAVDGIQIPNTGTVTGITISNSSFNNSGGAGVHLINTSNVTISNTIASSNTTNGFDISGGGSTMSLTNVTANSNTLSGISVNNYTNLTVTGSTLNHNVTNGVSLANTGSSATISHSTASFNLQDGFNVHGTWSGTVFDTDVAEQNGVDGQNGDGDGFTFHDTTTGTIRYSLSKNNIKSAVAHVGNSSVNMEYNIFSHTTNGTIALVYVEGGTYTLLNTVIYSGGQTGVGVQLAGTGNLTIKNTIVQGFATGIEQLLGSITNDYNIVHGASTASYHNITAGSHSLAVDPHFTDPSHGDFTLTSTSPAIDAGVNLGLTKDYIGVAVPQGSSPDIGAYEHSVVPTPTPTNTTASALDLQLLAIGSIKTIAGTQTYYYTGHRPTFSGTSTPDSTITVEIHSDPIILTTTADNSGNWSVTPTQDIPNGSHTVTISATKDGVTNTLTTYTLGINTGLAETGSPIWPLGVVGLLIVFSSRQYLKRQFNRS